MSLHVVVIEDRSGDMPLRSYGPYKFRESAVTARLTWARRRAQQQWFSRQYLREEYAADEIASARWIATVRPLDATEAL